MSAKVSEQAWISSAANGDLDAFNQLVLAYQDLAYQYASLLVQDADSADDITQESFIKAYLNIHRFRGGSFRIWLLKIVRNTARDRWRRILRHPTVTLFPKDEEGHELDSPVWIADPEVSVERFVQRKEEVHELHRLLDELPAEYRSVLILIDVHELDYLEAAEILNIPLGTVKSRLARARCQMRSKLRSTPDVLLPLAA